MLYAYDDLNLCRRDFENLRFASNFIPVSRRLLSNRSLLSVGRFHRVVVLHHV